MKIEFTNKSIFSVRSNMLVNPVNCVSVMGAGLAKEFRQRYKYTHMFSQYTNYCLLKSLHLGGNPCLSKISESEYVVLFPTKHHWNENSSLENIVLSLEHMLDWNYPELSIAFPKIGCGLGGLDYEKDLKPIFLEMLPKMNFERIYVCE